MPYNLLFILKNKDLWDKFRAKGDESSLHRQKEREEQMKMLTEMSKITFKKNDYQTAIDTLTRGMDNLSNYTKIG